MKEIQGRYATALVFTTANQQYSIDDYAVAQLQMICNHEVAANSIIRVMPDVHPGKVGTIGLTMTVSGKIMPNLLGIDIGCGMTLAKIKTKKVEFQKLDKVIRENIPAGFSVRNKVHHLAEEFDFSCLNCRKNIQLGKAKLSLGTLGGGNHFIEAGKGSDGGIYVVIHSGSRHLGKEVTDYYLNEGQKIHKSKGETVPYELTALDEELKEAYMHDVKNVQEYAALNRKIMLAEIIKGMRWKIADTFDCIHNYFDESSEVMDSYGNVMLRKGAISAKRDEKVIIPINMRDGIIIGTGKGNAEWNLSAPHGSGRILKREDVKNRHTVSAFKKEMNGIYSTCINADTLDESPFAYRSIDDIIAAIGETVKIEQIIKPVYNYKAGGR